jgi:tRNA nucleotidyltransferase/poly(A) polymerase
VRELKALVEIGLLIEQMGNAPRAFLEEVDEGLAKQVAQLRGWLADALAKWKDLPPEVKVERLAAGAPWRASKTGEGEYVAADEAPELAEAIKARQGRLYAGDYVYTLSRNGRWIQRYRRQGAAPAAAGSGARGERR